MDLTTQVAGWPVPTAAVAVVDATGVLATTGPADREFAWASVTKLLTALTVLDAVQDQLLGLDEPAGPAGSTVRHLLAHASGLGPEAVPGGKAVVAAPGQRRVYSNLGFEVLAELVADRSGVSFAERLEDRVCRPLGLGSAELLGSPAHGAHGAIADLAALGRELLRPTLLDEHLLAEATAVAFPGLAGVLPGFGRQEPNDWGLGFELRDGKSPHWTGAHNSPGTFGHFGRAGGFLWVDRDAGVACACLTDRDFGPWAAHAWPTLSDGVLESLGRTA